MRALSGVIWIVTVSPLFAASLSSSAIRNSPTPLSSYVRCVASRRSFPIRNCSSGNSKTAGTANNRSAVARPAATRPSRTRPTCAEIGCGTCEGPERERARATRYCFSPAAPSPCRVSARCSATHASVFEAGRRVCGRLRVRDGRPGSTCDASVSPTGSCAQRRRRGWMWRYPLVETGSGLSLALGPVAGWLVCDVRQGFPCADVRCGDVGPVAKLLGGADGHQIAIAGPSSCRGRRSGTRPSPCRVHRNNSRIQRNTTPPHAISPACPRHATPHLTRVEGRVQVAVPDMSSRAMGRC